MKPEKTVYRTGTTCYIEKKSGNSHFPVNEELEEIRWTEKSLTVI